MKITANSLEDLPEIAARIVKEYSCKTIAFYGKMGVGKTTFIKALCECLGVNSREISSPTYSIVNQYEAKNKQCVYHFDFYRIEDESEAYDIGYEEYFFSNAYCFIEWPDKIKDLLPDNTIWSYISKNEDESRTLTVEV